VCRRRHGLSLLDEGWQFVRCAASTSWSRREGTEEWEEAGGGGGVREGKGERRYESVEVQERRRARFQVSVLVHWSRRGVGGESWGRRAARLVAGMPVGTVRLTGGRPGRSIR
jgi:hypothetical protein